MTVRLVTFSNVIEEIDPDVISHGYIISDSGEKFLLKNFVYELGLKSSETLYVNNILFKSKLDYPSGCYHIHTKIYYYGPFLESYDRNVISLSSFLSLVKYPVPTKSARNI
jgi:hypothetical protein